MKRNLLALAVGAAIVMPGVALADAATVYGRMDVSLDRVSIDNDTGGDDNGTNWAVSSNASRFGVKGGADLTDSLKALYVIEWQVSGDGDAGDLAMRNRYVGLSGGFGKVVAGRMDTPMKTSQGKFDLFNDHAADIKSLTNITVAGITVGSEVRASNLLAYVSPKIGGLLTATVAVQPGEENESDLGNCTGDQGKTGDCYDGVADAYSVSLTGEQNGLYGAFAYDNNVTGLDTMRLVGVFSQDNLQVGALYESSELNDDLNVSNDVKKSVIIFNGAMTSGKNVFKAQIGQSTIDWDISGADDTETTVFALGADHNFTKQTKAYVEYTNNSTKDFIDTVALKITDPQTSVFSVGMLHKF